MSSQLAQASLDFYSEAQKKNLPTAVSGADQTGAGFGNFLGGLLSGVMMIAALLLFFYLIWGGIEWITAAGESGKIQKARDKMTQAVIGIIVLAASVAIFSLVQEFLGIEVINFFGSQSSVQSGVNAAQSGTTGGAASGGSSFFGLGF